MRLIDADYVTEKLNEINGTAELDKAFEVVENAPTVNVLEQIRDEIKELQQDILLSSENPLDSTYNISVGISMVLGVIKKYMKGGKE